MVLLDDSPEMLLVGIKQGEHLSQLHVLLESVDPLVQSLVKRMVIEKRIFVVPIIYIAFFSLLQDPYLRGKRLKFLRQLSVRTNNVLQIWVFLEERKRVDLSIGQQIG